jgi:putative oxidoreductase
MKTNTPIQLIAAALILLFLMTAISKLTDFSLFREQMYKQHLPHEAAKFLIWTLPGTELMVSGLLFFEQTRRYGFMASAVLMALFTGYITLVLTGFFSHVPCACGGVIKAMGWKLHLFFNFFFLLLSFLGIYLLNRERRIIGKE